MTVQAFSTETIVKTHQSTLRQYFISDVCAITSAGRLYVSSADDIRYNSLTENGEIRVWGEWIPLTGQGIALWACRERLNWRMPDGTILGPDDPYPLPQTVDGGSRAPIIFDDGRD